MPGGKVAVVPDDGLTMRERRTRPLLVVHTGDGKGKSTAAFGLALRAWSAGWPIGVFQFTKSPKWRVGEEGALKALGEIHAATGHGAGHLAQDGRGLVVAADPAGGPRPRRPGGLGAGQA